MTQEEIKAILHKAEELARQDYHQLNISANTCFTCLRTLRYIIKAMEARNDTSKKL